MAAGAVQAELTSVHLWVLVTGQTVARHAGKGILDVTVLARRVAVPTLQGKETIMLELDHPILAIMAGQAVASKPRRVLAHIVGILPIVATGAVDRLRPIPVLPVAALAGQRAAIVASLVEGQAEAGQPSVVDVGKGHRADDGIAPLVFLVTGLALFGAGEQAVQACGLGPLLGDLKVTLLAQVGRQATNRRVTVFALPLECGVRLVTLARPTARAGCRYRPRIVTFLESPRPPHQREDQEQEDKVASNG
jgi:hypothetical protein